MNLKKQIILLYQNGKTILEIFKEYKVSKSSVYQWIEKFHNSGSFKAKNNRTVEKINWLPCGKN
ncbi:helix-turn-helix domain-containing protein [Spiroplasma endosymbiont of Polydrusus formosus]|uniref:helix-turn-helix domain-containing protein n=1 Tax=Spiroplasma endosymbiont of Polydrusus formosus TaxID=3139326 RepID=UPI0035B53E95